MAKNLIIVESPAKTRTLKKFLGRGYALEASMGHIRDLEKKDLGLGEDFEPRYAVLEAKKKVVSKLRSAAKKAETVYLAPDPDREGEAIAWHIAEIIGKEPEAIRRVTFNEITRRAVLKALEEPGEIDIQKVEAQQARRILDRLMGFKLSPLLWEKVRRGLSAGRVQSVALKMVCDRQAEIDAFNPEEYWLIDVEVAAPEPPPFKARLHKIDGKKAKVGDGDTAAGIVKTLESEPLSIAAVVRKESRQKPTPPFITSRLQQEAARRFGFTVKRTMAVAQGLYEGKEIGDRGAIGLITYMRTDSTRVSDDALAAARDYIVNTYGKEMLPKKPNVYRSRKGAQDAHEAIRPTTFDLPPDRAAEYLKGDDLKLYRLIWDRFIASQMTPAVFDVTQIDVECDRYLLRATGRILKKPGHLSVYQEAKGEGAADAEDPTAQLPEVKQGQDLERRGVTSEQKFTKPPARYSEATLVKALEENGIGRPSTYASILATLSDRSYVDKAGRRFRPTALGKVVNNLLQAGFSDIINEGYTAELEVELDRVENGELGWKEALTSFDKKFSRDLEAADREMPNVKKDGLETDEKCPECSSPLVIRFGRYGGFYGCTTYPDCSYTRNVDEEEGVEGGETPTDEEVPPCEKCGKPMGLKRSRYGPFYGCTGYPDCKNIRKTAKPEKPVDTGVKCPECGEGSIHQKRSRRGKIFYSCNRYPDCEYALWNLPVAEPCPQCKAPFVVEKTTKKKGTFRFCQKEECDWEAPVEPDESDESDES